MRPQVDDYPRHIEHAIRMLLLDGIAAGASGLEPIAVPPREVQRQPGLSRKTRCEIFRRDGFRCRYCGVRPS